MPEAPVRTRLLVWLQERDPWRLEQLRAAADAVRRETVGEAVHLRGLIEISSHCVRGCGYCGLRAGNRGLARYRMDAGAVLACARQARDLGYGTVVLQAGEDPGLDRGFIAGLVARLKEETGLAVTLSLGERSLEDLAAWRAAGADRYLLRFETSDPALFRRIHPGPGRDRLRLLHGLRRLGYQVGTGVMVGLPGQTWASLAEDLLRFRELDPDMIGVGPYLPHPQTPLGREAHAGEVPNDVATTLKVIALARLLCPEANIPATTALATLDPAQGRERGLRAGANVVMPNLTPAPYREGYEIYPGKACVTETAAACAGCLAQRIRGLGRSLGNGAGERRMSGGRRPHELSRLAVTNAAPVRL